MAYFGYAQKGASTNTDPFNAGNSKIVGLYTLPITGAISEIQFMCTNVNVATRVGKGIIYSSVAGEPDTLLATTTESIIPILNANTARFIFSTPVVLAAGDYYIGMINDSVDGLMYTQWFSDTGGTTRYNANTYASGPTSTFGAATSTTDMTSVYALYTPIVSIPWLKA